MRSSGGIAQCGICAIIARVQAGEAPDFIAELPHSFVMLGDAQFYRGYCLMLAKRHATEIFLMAADEAHALFEEMRLVAEAIAAVTHPWKMNYECLGNAEPHVHWHLLPRYESDEMRRAPIWMRPEAERRAPLTDDDRRALRAALIEQISLRIPDARVASH